MRHVRREIYKIPCTDFRGKLEPFSPAYLSTSFHNIDSNLVAPMMMRSSLCPGLQSDCPDPRLPSSRASEVKSGGPSHFRCPRHRALNRLSAHKPYAIGLPIY